eukprot:5290696-Prymnesium_polylepis.1
MTGRMVQNCAVPATTPMTPTTPTTPTNDSDDSDDSDDTDELKEPPAKRVTRHSQGVETTPDARSLRRLTPVCTNMQPPPAYYLMRSRRKQKRSVESASTANAVPMSGAVAMALVLGGSAGMAAPTPGVGSTSLSPLELMSATKVPFAAPADDSASPAPAQVFVYDLPESFHTGQLATSAGLTVAAKLEHRLHTLFRTSRNRAANSSAATMFYVPVYPVATCEGLGKSSGCSEGLALVKAAIAYIRSSAPHWDRFEGADHIIAAVGDHGSSFLPEDDLLARPKMLGKAILLTPRVAPRALYEQST